MTLENQWLRYHLLVSKLHVLSTCGNHGEVVSNLSLTGPKTTGISNSDQLRNRTGNHLCQWQGWFSGGGHKPLRSPVFTLKRTNLGYSCATDKGSLVNDSDTLVQIF